MREALLPNRFWTALQRLNPHLPPEALRDAASEVTRDRSAMLPTDANAKSHALLRNGVPVHIRGAEGELKRELARIIDWRDAQSNDLLTLSRSGSRVISTSAVPTSWALSTDCLCS
jgi:type I restriction enzyme R subunit